MTRFCCETCRVHVPDHQVVRSHEGKATGCMLGLTAGAASKNVWATLGMALVGVLVGHLIDELVTPKCPWCGEVLQVIASEILN